jgi:hypothetical protein
MTTRALCRRRHLDLIPESYRDEWISRATPEKIRDRIARIRQDTADLATEEAWLTALLDVDGR